MYYSWCPIIRHENKQVNFDTRTDKGHPKEAEHTMIQILDSAGKNLKADII